MYYDFDLNKADVRRTQFPMILTRLKEMNEELKQSGNKFFGGSSPGMTDFMIWPWIERLPIFDLAFPGEGLVIPDSLVELLNWVKDMWEVPAIKQYGLSPQILLRYKQSSAATGVPDYDNIIKPEN